MNWFVSTFSSSIGKKFLMALTGLFFSLFLVAHLAGNLNLFIGMDAFNAYAAHLQSLGILVTVAEIGLIVFALIHITTGLTLFLANRKARPVSYAVSATSGGRTIGSGTMPYTGIFMLCFVIVHLINFRFVDLTHQTIYEYVAGTFDNPFYVFFYVLTMAVVAVHVSHGFWSAFQTLGANHPKYMPTIKNVGLVLSILFGFGFGFIPIYILLIA